METTKNRIGFGIPKPPVKDAIALKKEQANEDCEEDKTFTAPVNGIYKLNSTKGIKLVKRLKKGETISLETGEKV